MAEITKREFPVCRVCGGAEWASELLSQDIAAPADGIKYFSMTVIHLKPPAQCIVSCPTIIAFEDYCATCGTRRAKRIERREVPVVTPPNFSPVEL